MKHINNIKRPSWISLKARKFDKLWLDKNENTHPRLQLYIKKLLKKLILFIFLLILIWKFMPKNFLLKNTPNNIIFGHGSDGCIKTFLKRLSKKSKSNINPNLCHV